MPHTHSSSTYRVSRTDAIAGFASIAGVSVPALDVQDLTWEGSGPEGVFVIEHLTSVLPNDPQPPFEHLRRNFTDISFVEVRDSFFPTIPMQIFEGVRAEINSTYVVFSL